MEFKFGDVAGFRIFLFLFFSFSNLILVFFLLGFLIFFFLFFSFSNFFLFFFFFFFFF
jgi:hypothetical protein